MDQEKLSRQHETKTIADLVHLYGNDMLDLSPAFQRKSVWVLRDRQKLIAKLEQEGTILTDKKRNRLAWDLLRAFSVEVDKIRESQRKLVATKPAHEIYRDYLLTVSQMTDDVSQRRRREQILRGVIGSIFARKDEQRGFSTEQRRILWNTSAEKKCQSCGIKLGWTNFTIDHVDPHSKGGRSDLENAALMCGKCNSAKGNRRSALKRA